MSRISALHSQTGHPDKMHRVHIKELYSCGNEMFMGSGTVFAISRADDSVTLG